MFTKCKIIYFLTQRSLLTVQRKTKKDMQLIKIHTTKTIMQSNQSQTKTNPPNQP